MHACIHHLINLLISKLLETSPTHLVDPPAPSHTSGRSTVAAPSHLCPLVFGGRRNRMHAKILSLTKKIVLQPSPLCSWPTKTPSCPPLTPSTAPLPQSKHSYGPHVAQNRPTPLPTVYKATRRPQPPTAVSFHSHTTTLPS
jgi:hypothetical protein